MEPRKDHPRTTRRPRHLVLIVTAAVAFVLGVTGAWAALRDSGSTQAAPTTPVATVTPEPTAPPSSPTKPPRKPSPTVEPTSEPTVEPTSEPTVDPYALADGTYPAYMRKVVVDASTVRVDVIQVYLNDDAPREARKDGMSWRDSRYLHLYVRNENPMLRTLPVAGDARIEFVGGCLADDTLAGLRDLYRASTPFTDAYYYDLVVSDGAVIDITQHYTVEGC